ncbi:hypothetical protein Tco_0828299 [Tanacetum coccineum]
MTMSIDKRVFICDIMRQVSDERRETRMAEEGLCIASSGHDVAFFNGQQSTCDTDSYVLTGFCLKLCGGLLSFTPLSIHSLFNSLTPSMLPGRHYQHLVVIVPVVS